nr:PfkB family carbohydrate kinase [Patulibacter sp. SYSU D01012]
MFAVEGVRVGEIHRPLELVAVPGGKGLNAARAARALDAHVLAVVLLAGHAGRWVAEALRGDGMHVDAAWSPGETRTCLTVADRTSGRPTEFYERGDDTPPAAWDAFADRVRAAGVVAGWVGVSGSLPPGVAPECAGELVERARSAGARVAVDHDGPTLAAALAAAPDLVKVNAAEARGLTGAGGVVQAACALHASLTAARGARGLPPGVAIVTAGEDGAYAVGPDGVVRHGAVDARGPYPTGSGDSFLGALLAHADRRPQDWDGALASALGAAAANAESPGAAHFAPERARTLADRAHIVRVER